MSDGFGTLGQKSICAKPDTLLFIDWYSVCFFFGYYSCLSAMLFFSGVVSINEQPGQQPQH